VYSKPSLGAAAGTAVAAPAVLGGDATWYILSGILGLVVAGLVTVRILGRRNGRGGGRGGRH